MPSTPDPNYWGNPPQTPRSSNIPQQPAQHTAPKPPMGAQPATPVQGSTAPQQQVPFTPVNNNGPKQANSNYQQVPQGASTPPAPAAPPAPVHPAKKKMGVVVAVAIIAALLVGMGGCAACTAVVSATLDNADDTWHAHGDFDEGYQNYSAPISEQEFLNRETRTDFGLVGSAALDSAELDAIQSNFFDNAGKAPDANGAYAAGVYRVGTDIPAGDYWFTGDKANLSTFYILQPTSAGATTYDTVHINSYYGHNLMDLREGEVFILDNDGSMLPLDQMTESFMPPYGSGVYRVGVDIPEGTYQLVVGDGADDYSSCTVMADLDFDENSSYLYRNYFIKGDKPGTITLEAGTYVRALQHADEAHRIGVVSAGLYRTLRKQIRDEASVSLIPVFC